MLSEAEINVLFDRCLDLTRAANKVLDLAESEKGREEIIADLADRLIDIEKAVRDIRTEFSIKI